MSVHIGEVFQIFFCICFDIPVMRTPLQILFLILVRGSFLHGGRMKWHNLSIRFNLIAIFQFNRMHSEFDAKRTVPTSIRRPAAPSAPQVTDLPPSIALGMERAQAHAAG